MKLGYTLLKLDLRLFDAGASAPAGAVSGEGAALGESNSLSSVAGKGKRAGNPLSKVQYGIQDAESGSGSVTGDAESTQCAEEGEEAKGQDAADKPTAATASDAPEAKKAAFEQLISGEYKELFGERVQGIIDRRFKETKALQSQLDSIKPVMAMLAARYGVADGDIRRLSQAIARDDAYYEQEAADKGLTVGQLKEMKRLEFENAELRRTREEAERRQNADRIYSEWLQQGESVKAMYPHFDLQSEIQNPDFLKLLRSGVDVKAAYQAVHMDEILGGAMQYAAHMAQEQTVNSIKSRSNRPIENGLSSQTGVVVKSDVSGLSAADRREIARRAQRGEQIRF